jgi:hypothetical protein
VFTGSVCARGAAGIYCADALRDNTGVHGFGALQLESSNESDANGWNQPQYYSTIAITDKINGRGALGVYAGGDYALQ